MRPQLLTRSRLAVLGGAVVLALGLSACSSGQVVSSRPDRFYLRVPAGWKTYHEAQLLRSPKWSTLSIDPPRFFLAASAAPHPDIGQPLSASKYPWAVLLVEDLSGSAQQDLTFSSLSDLLVPVDQLSQQGVPVQELQQGQLLVKGALRGTKMAFEVGGGTSGAAIDYQQVSWVNSATNRVWALMVGCSPNCYKANSSLINSVLQSFYVSDIPIG